MCDINQKTLMCVCPFTHKTQCVQCLVHIHVPPLYALLVTGLKEILAVNLMTGKLALNSGNSEIFHECIKYVSLLNG